MTRRYMRCCRVPATFAGVKTVHNANWDNAWRGLGGRVAGATSGVSESCGFRAVCRFPVDITLDLRDGGWERRWRCRDWPGAGRACDQRSACRPTVPPLRAGLVGGGVLLWIAATRVCVLGETEDVPPGGGPKREHRTSDAAEAVLSGCMPPCRAPHTCGRRVEGVVRSPGLLVGVCRVQQVRGWQNAACKEGLG